MVKYEDLYIKEDSAWYLKGADGKKIEGMSMTIKSGALTIATELDMGLVKVTSTVTIKLSGKVTLADWTKDAKELAL